VVGDRRSDPSRVPTDPGRGEAKRHVVYGELTVTSPGGGKKIAVLDRDRPATASARVVRGFFFFFFWVGACAKAAATQAAGRCAARCDAWGAVDAAWSRSSGSREATARAHHEQLRTGGKAMMEHRFGTPTMDRRPGGAAGARRRSTQGWATSWPAGGRGCRGCASRRSTRSTRDGPKTLAQLFDGQLAVLVYHFMLGRGRGRLPVARRSPWFQRLEVTSPTGTMRG